MAARTIPRLAALAAAALLMTNGAADAQRVSPGAPRVNQSDVTGPAVTSSDQLLFEPGVVQSVSCAAAWGIRTAGRAVGEELGQGTLAVAFSAPRVLSDTAQEEVARLLAGGRGGRFAGRQVRTALVPPSNDAARRPAGRLVQRLEGLLTAVGRMDPRDPGRGAPTQLYEAVAAWDEFVDSSSVAFLSAPPDEMLAIQAVLRRLDYAAIEHARRDGDAWRVDDFGLACAAALPARAEEPVVEVPFEVCVLSDGGFRGVSGLYFPAAGDSLVEVGGVRRRLREAYPDSAGYALGAPWFGRDLPVTFGGREYRQWGMSRVAAPGELVRAGELAGVAVFAAPGEGTPPEVIYVPFRRGCEVQGYRRAVEILKVRG